MPACKHRTQAGFTYFGALFTVALIGLALSGAALVSRVMQQREKETELIFIGQQYVDAIASYYRAGNRYPRSIDELLRDPRYLVVKHHLRKPWRDPMTGSKKWGLVYTRQGGIAGIYSLASGTPLKQKGFGLLEPLLSGKNSYQDWKFVYIAAADRTAQKHASNSEETIQTDSGEDNAKEETGAELLLLN